MGAALTKQLVAGPERVALLRAVPASVRYELDPSTCAEARPSVDQPRGLVWLWRLAVALGPTAYAASALTLTSRRWLQRKPRRALQSMQSRADRALVALAVATCLVAPVLVATRAPPELRLPAVLVLLCVAPGTALMIALGRRSLSAEPGLVLGASLAVAALLAQTMLWVGTWSPRAVLYLLAVGCLLPLLAHLRDPTYTTQTGGSERADGSGDEARCEAHGLQSAALTPGGLPNVESPPCAATGACGEPPSRS